MFQILEPFSWEFFQRAAVGGSLVAVLCGVVGTWVVIRSMAFLGEALAHGMLPGVALATVVGFPVLLGAALSAGAMSLGISVLQRRGRLSYDTSIGLLFVAMLALGVIVISHSGSFATDATAILFGDILAISEHDVRFLAVATAVTLVVAVVAHRPLLALAFDARVAAVLGLRPVLAQALLVGLVTLAVVVSYQAVGSLLVVGLLIAPAVAASQWTQRIPTTMALAASLGVVAVLTGLLVSWFAATAAGSSIAMTAIALAAASWLVRISSRRLAGVLSARAPRPAWSPPPDHLTAPRQKRFPVPPPYLTLATLVVVLSLAAACSRDDSTPASSPTSGEKDDHGAVQGAVELAEPALGLTTIDADGHVRHLDLVGGDVTELGTVPGAREVHTDGRFLYAETPAGVEVIDSGVWTWDHVDHFHYYRTDARTAGPVAGQGPVTTATTTSSTSGGSGLFFEGSGEAVLLDVAALADGKVVEHYRVRTAPHAGLLVPVGEHALMTQSDAPGGSATRVVALDSEGEPVDGQPGYPCADAAGTITTRVGAVIGCADGALLATVVGEELEVERISYPDRATAPPARSFAGRDGRPTVAGLADQRRVWLLDTRARTWRLLRSPVALSEVVAVDDDDEHVVGLSTDGRIVVLDGESGELLGRSARLAARSMRSGVGTPTLVADQQRVYLSAPAERRLYEIDFSDAARVSRVFDTETTPLLLAGTGR